MLVKKILISCAAAICVALMASGASPKREFRGAWLHTVYQSQYKNMGTEKCKQYLRSQLDSLHSMGVNAVIFQVRPQSDAFYASELEPWSRFLTDNGKAPSPYWDPLQFMVEESHARGMELHAWLNPYRVTSSAKQNKQKNHIYHKHPERFVRYDGKLYFNPALKENREFICKVVEDIVSRYDVDAIHFDDYFYPYPVAGKNFPDAAQYAKSGKKLSLGDWRRKNVDMLIEELNTTIKKLKPWVRFGISPFGIWRNKKSDSRGSDTNGLENYDSLYADVLLWEEKGWIDYLMPQLYWELDHKSASYRVLVDWWNNNAGKNRHLFIGQDVERTMKKNELATKIASTRNLSNIAGNCWWPGYSLTRNSGSVADSLSINHQKTIAIPPACPWLGETAPAAPGDIAVELDKTIVWTAGIPEGKTGDAVRFAVYRFESPEDIDIESAEALKCVTPDMFYKPTEAGVYVITALDRINNESEPSVPVMIK